VENSGGGAHAHISRLQALTELGIIDAPSQQLSALLSDCCAALKCDYCEVGEAYDEGNGYRALSTIGDGGPEGLGTYAPRSTQPHLVADVMQTDIAAAPVCVRLGLRSVLYRPFIVRGRLRILTIAWRTQHDAVSDAERAYLEALTPLLSRVFDGIERERQIIERGNKDPLTGLPNRAAVLDQLDQAISAAERARSRVAVLYIDLKDFKRINDLYGHAAGDATLREIAARMQRALRRHETCGRIGGDEFCIVVSQVADREQIEALAQRLLSALNQTLSYADANFVTSASIGIALYPDDGNSVTDLLVHADRAMYRAKMKGRTAYAFYANGVQEGVEWPLHISIENFETQFILCYQGIVAAHSGKPVVAESLVRWLHPSGMRLPQDFLSFARRQGVLTNFERLMLEVIVQKAPILRHTADIVLHVNVSEANDALLGVAPPAASPIALEFSEEQVSREPERYAQFISRCRAKGYRVGLSHFGTAGLPLQTLHDMRLDFVKIQSAALVGKELGRRQSRLLKSIIEQAHRMSSLVIAENVETTLERQWLEESGVDALQGFHISSPLTERDFLTWLSYHASR
jgi:diguanylate cyclase (GGDEF)-like protein